MFVLNGRQTLAAIAMALTLSGGTLVVANAQTTPTPVSTQTTGTEHHKGARGMFATVAAQAIGITPEELRQELPGKSLAQVAQAHGKNSADVASALKQAADARIDQAMTRVVPATENSD